MLLGKFRKHIEEIRRKHPRLDVEIRMSSYLSERFLIVIFDGDARLYTKRILNASDLDLYTGDAEDLLIMVLDHLVEEMERSKNAR